MTNLRFVVGSHATQLKGTELNSPNQLLERTAIKVLQNFGLHEPNKLIDIRDQILWLIIGWTRLGPC